MKLIIDIPKDDYEFIVNEVDMGYYNDIRQINNRLYHFVANGTVLKQGKWIKRVDEHRDEYYECSFCGVTPSYNSIKNFCPNCGADMRGDTDGNS